MAEPLTLIVSIAVIISSTTAFTSLTYNTVAQVKNSRYDFYRQKAELEVLLLVLRECEGTIKNVSEIPQSLEAAMDVCIARHRDLFEILEAIRMEDFDSSGVIHRLRFGARYVVRNKDRERAMEGFRESVLLIRDLAADLRMQRQLIKMSTGMTELMAEIIEEDHDSFDATSIKSTIGIAERTNMEPGTIINPGHATRQLTVDSNRPRRHAGSVLREISNLMQTDWTRNFTISIQVDVHSPPIFIPARAKIDTGCEENLIAIEVLKRAEIGEEELHKLLTPIESEKRIVFEGVESATFSPEHQILLTLYQDGHLRPTKDTFYVVHHAPFEINIGLKKFARDFRQQGPARSPALFIKGRSKTKEERNRHQQNRERQLADATLLELEQIRHAHAEREQQAAPNQQSQQSQQSQQNQQNHQNHQNQHGAISTPPNNP